MQHIQVPTIFYWEEKDMHDTVRLMTAAFTWHSKLYGMSALPPGNKVRNKAQRKALISTVTDTLDVLIHHGENVIDRAGYIHPEKVNEAEADRYWNDPLWKKRVTALRKVIMVKEVSYQEAHKLGLI